LEDGSFVSGSYGGALKRWSGDDGTVLQSFSGHSRNLCDVVKLKGDIIASSAGDETLKMWRLSTGECLHSIVTNSFYWDLMTLSGGYFVAGAFGRRINVWNQEGECVQTLQIECFNTVTGVGDTVIIAQSSRIEVMRWCLKLRPAFILLMLSLSSLVSILFSLSLTLSLSLT